MRLDNLRHPRRARLIVEVTQYRAGIENVSHHGKFTVNVVIPNRASSPVRNLLLFSDRYQRSFLRRRSRLSASEREGLPEKSPRVLSTNSSDTGSRTIRDPSCVTAIRVPGPMPREALISEGMTN